MRTRRDVLDMVLALTADEVETAESFYVSACADLNTFSEITGIERELVGDITAMLSPRVDVRRANKMAAEFLLNGSTEGIMAQRLGAIDNYLRQASEGTRQLTQTPGSKVDLFARNLNGDFDSICCDVWIFRLFLPDEEYSPTPAKYQAIEGRIRELATAFGMSNAACQSTLWSAIRKYHNEQVSVPVELCSHLPD